MLQPIKLVGINPNDIYVVEADNVDIEKAIDSTYANKNTGKFQEDFIKQKIKSQEQTIALRDKVTVKNPRTKKLYRLCEFHREKIDKKKKI